MNRNTRCFWGALKDHEHKLNKVRPRRKNIYDISRVNLMVRFELTNGRKYT